MKAGIVTIYDNINYGNRLQNYALQTLLQSHGVDVETLRIYPHGMGLLIKIGLSCVAPSYKKRQKVFEKFTKNRIKTRLIEPCSVRSLRKLNKEFDFFFAGSDQIWNPYFLTSKHANLLKFADKEKSFGFAGSFGISKLPNRFKHTYQKGFEGFKYIAVREIAGKKIIDELCGDGASEIMPDPSLLLTKAEWLEFAKNEKPENEKYILTYFLGKKGDAFKHIEQIAKENGLKIIHLNQKCQKEYFAASPEKFISLFANASLICTNSFHGCAFSVKFEKPFILFKRDSYNLDMSSRTTSLFEFYGIKDRSFDKLDKGEYFDLDYSNVDQESQIKRAHEYLKKCIGV